MLSPALRPPATKVKPTFDAQAYLRGLDPECEQLAPLRALDRKLVDLDGVKKAAILVVTQFAGRELESRVWLRRSLSETSSRAAVSVTNS